jgi:hypothetical protein
MGADDIRKFCPRDFFAKYFSCIPLQYAKISLMYTVPQMPQETESLQVKTFPSLWSLTYSTFKSWRGGWAIFSLINLGTVLIGTLAWVSIVSIMPWIKAFLKEGYNIDPTIISSHYPTTASLITDLASVCGILLVFIICIIISQIMTIHATNPESRHKGITYLFMHSIRMAPRYMWTMALVSMIIIGGFSLLIIPGMLLLPLAMTAFFVAALEHKSGIKAVVQSAYYSKGYIVEALWRSLLVILVIHIVSLLLPLLATMIVYPFTLLNFSEHTIKVLSFTAGTLYTFISFILSLIMPSILIIFYFHIYSHMKDNPSNARPVSKHVLVTLAWIGVTLIASLFLLEAFGF